jgi:hypothetical protein
MTTGREPAEEGGEPPCSAVVADAEGTIAFWNHAAAQLSAMEQRASPAG